MCTRFVYNGDDTVVGFNFDIDLSVWTHAVITEKDRFFIGIKMPDSLQREINSQLENEGIGTKGRQALKLQHEQGKLERKVKSRGQKEAEKERQLRYFEITTHRLCFLGSKIFSCLCLCLLQQFVSASYSAFCEAVSP